MEEHRFNDSSDVLLLKHAGRTLRTGVWVTSLLLQGERMQFSQKTHQVFFHRGMMRINGLRDCLMKREKRERRQINTDRAVIEKKKGGASNWLCRPEVGRLFLASIVYFPSSLLPSFHCDCWRASTLQLIWCQEVLRNDHCCLRLPPASWLLVIILLSVHLVLYLCKYFFVSSYGRDASFGAFKAIAALLKLIISVGHSV